MSLAGRVARSIVLGLALAGTLPGAATAAGGDIFVADFNAFSDGGGGVIRVNPSTGARSTVSANATPPGGPTFADPGGIVRAPNNDLLVADLNAYGGPGGVLRVNPVSGARSTVSENLAPLGGPSFADPSGIAIDRNGDLLIADRSAFADFTGGVIRVDRETGVRTAVSHNAAPAGGPSFVEPVGIALSPDGAILVTDEDAFAGSSGGVIRVDPVTGQRSTISANGAPAGGPSFVEPVGLVPEPDGRLLVVEEDGFADAAGGVIRVDPATGARTGVSANGAPAGGPSFRQPYGAALAADGSLLVADFDAFTGAAGGIIRVARVSGGRRAVSANAAPVGGPQFVDPLGIALAPAPRTAMPPPPPAPGAARDVVAPVIRSASLRPRTFAAAGRRRVGRRVARGATLRWSLSEAARVVFLIERSAPGRRVGKRCRRPTPGNKGRRPCVRLLRAGSFARRARRGANRTRFSGRLEGSPLSPGRYRLTLRASDAAANRSRARRLSFRVVR